ncbi:unnamed protein product, partial [Candidula unifasciata]
MDSAHGRRPPAAKTSLRRGPDFDIRPDTEVIPQSRGDHERPKSTNVQTAVIAHLSRSSEAKPVKVMSKSGHSSDGGAMSTSRTAQNSSDRRTGVKKKPDKASPKEANGSFENTQSYLTTGKKPSSFPERLKDQRTWEHSKSSSQTPKNRKSERGASKSTDMEMASTRQSSSTVQKISVDPTAQNKYASMPIIRLSYEDSETQIGIDNENEHINIPNDTAKVERKDRKVTQRTALIEKNSRMSASSEKVREKQSQNKHFSGDKDTTEQEKSLLNDRQGHSKSMQLLIPKRHHRRRSSNRKTESVAVEIPSSGATNSTALPQKRPSSTQKKPASFKFFQSLKKFSFRGTKSTAVSPTLSRPRKKFSIGHVSQDPLEVGYEILDDTVTTVVPRTSIPTMAEKRRSVPNNEHRKSSVEEPLLSKHLGSDVKVDTHPPKSLRISFMQTFPRTKHQRSEQYSSFLELNRPRPTPASSLSETASHFISNQLQSPPSTFTTFHKTPSSSSFISADARSEVCLDIIDAVVDFGCGRAWVTDNHFVLSKHVYNMPGYIENLEDLQNFVSKMAGEPVSPDHPLWEIQVLHNFREPRDTVLLFRMHLCMTDGESLIQILEDALVDSQKICHQKREFSRQASNVSALRILFGGPVTFLTKYFFRRPDYNLLHGAHICPSGEMVVAWSEPFSLSAAMRIKQVARCTLGELFLSITAGNMRTYLQMFGITHPYDISCVVPVDIHEDNDDAVEIGNNYSLVIMQLPTNTEGIIPRLWQVKYDMAQFKSSAEAAVVNDARWLTCALLPISAFQRMWRKLETLSKLLAHRRIPEDAAYKARCETNRSLSNLTLDDLTADQIQLEMSLVEQEVHDLKIQLNSSSSHRISDEDIHLMSRIEALKERSRELMLHLRKRKAEESENAIILTEE